MLPEEIGAAASRWADGFNASVTVCDREGIVVYMNRKSAEQFQKYGGESLIGRNLADCHPEPARSKLLEMLSLPMENIYTTEKEGRRRMFLQKPWMHGGSFMGVVEISFELPEVVVHHVRKT